MRSICLAAALLSLSPSISRGGGETFTNVDASYYEAALDAVDHGAGPLDYLAQRPGLDHLEQRLARLEQDPSLPTILPTLDIFLASGGTTEGRLAAIRERVAVLNKRIRIARLLDGPTPPFARRTLIAPTPFQPIGLLIEE